MASTDSYNPSSSELDRAAHQDLDYNNRDASSEYPINFPAVSRQNDSGNTILCNIKKNLGSMDEHI